MNEVDRITKLHILLKNDGWVSPLMEKIVSEIDLKTETQKIAKEGKYILATVSEYGLPSGFFRLTYIEKAKMNEEIFKTA